MAPGRPPSPAFSWASMEGSDGQPSLASGFAPAGPASARALLELAAVRGAEELFSEVSRMVHEELGGDVWQVRRSEPMRGMAPDARGPA
jgi:hypothetical protein